MEADVAPDGGGGFRGIDVFEREEVGSEGVAFREGFRGPVHGETAGEIGLG